MFGIHVVFNERGYWSKAYTYKSNKAYEKGSIVVVPTGSFYSVGKVIESVENFKFKEDINYKFIVQEVQL